MVRTKRYEAHKKKTRKFNGKLYEKKQGWSSLRKDFAEEDAKKFRKEGLNVRIVKVVFLRDYDKKPVKMWELFTRKR